ncbi:uncharacterized protein [Procambarus clarkii]|uniref:uncharacterized protein n=1 Tax=Procambarus clarkii TaxID=6728 RepID=UPI0037436117
MVELVPITSYIILALVPITSYIMLELVPITSYIMLALVPITSYIMVELVPITSYIMVELVPITSYIMVELVPITSYIMLELVPITSYIMVELVPITSYIMVELVPITSYIMVELVPITSYIMVELVPITSYIMLALVPITSYIMVELVPITSYIMVELVPITSYIMVELVPITSYIMLELVPITSYIMVELVPITSYIMVELVPITSYIMVELVPITSYIMVELVPITSYIMLELVPITSYIMLELVPITSYIMLALVPITSYIMLQLVPITSYIMVELVPITSYIMLELVPITSYIMVELVPITSYIMLELVPITSYIMLELVPITSYIMLEFPLIYAMIKQVLKLLQCVVRSVWVVRGGRADLPCAPTPKHTEDSALLVLWYISSETVPVYSYDAREGEFTSGVRWADEGVLGGRALFMPTSEPPTLVLEPAHARDQGVYKCRVDYRLSPSTTAYVNLTVVIPSGPPMILWRGHGVVSVLGPLTEGERAHLTCRTVGGRPPPTLTWIRRGQRLQPVSYNTTTDPATGTFRVEAAISIVGSRDLLGSTLSCHAHTSPHAHASLHALADLLPQTASVVVNVTLSPVEVRVVGGGAGVRAGTTLRLVCRAAGSHPPAHLTWWRAHARLPHVTHAVEAGGNVTTATLTLQVDRLHNGVTLACTAANPALPRAHHLTDTVKLNVVYPPVVRLSLGRPLDPGSIKEGDDVYFECRIVSNPPYQRVDWYHNGVLVRRNDTSGVVVVSGLNLILRSLRREHSGSYTCGATNAEGYNTSNTVTLTVRHAPVCAGDKRERTQGAARGSTAAVKCTVEAEPSHDLTWTWIRKRADGSEEEVPREDVRSEGLTSSVLLTPHTPDDYGRLLCSAANGVGPQRAACVVILVPAGPPDTPTNCTVAPIEPAAHAPTHAHTASLSITCIEGFDGGLPQHFTLETWQDASLTSNVSSMFPEWVVGGLRAGVGVTLRVAAHNARGRSDVIRLEVHTASAQQHAAPGSDWGVLGVPPLLGAIVGVGIVLVIVLITGIVIAKHTWRPQPPTHTHTLVMTPAPSQPDSCSSDTYDPDVVSSLRRHADNLDVLPQADYAHKTASGKSHATHRQAVVRTHGHGQNVTRAYVKRRGGNHPSIMRGFCLHRQDSSFGESNSDDSEDADSDSTFTDLTAAGRAAAALPPAVMYSNSLPRATKREFHHIASSSLDLQLRSCQRSQVMAASSEVIQRLPSLARNPRRATPASSEELRHITSSAEELHPLLFASDLRQLLSSGDLRHISFSGTELRMIPSTGTWPPMGSSSGELRVPLPASVTMHSLATEGLQILPTAPSSSSSPWDAQTMSSFKQLPPSLPSGSGMEPQLSYVEIQSQAPRLQLQERPPGEVLQSRSSRGVSSRTPHEETQPRPPCIDPQSRFFYTNPQPRSPCSEHRPMSYGPEFHPQAQHEYPQHQQQETCLQHLPSTTSSSSMYYTPAPCCEHRTTIPCLDPQPRPSCLKQRSVSPPPLSCVELDPPVSLRELQPPSPREEMLEEMQPLLPLVDLQPPPSFRSSPPAMASCTTVFSVPCNFPSYPLAIGTQPSSPVRCSTPASNETVSSAVPSVDGSPVYPTEAETSPSTVIHPATPTSLSMQKLLRFSGENPSYSTGNLRCPFAKDEFGLPGKVPAASISRSLHDQTLRPSASFSYSTPDTETQHSPATSNTNGATYTSTATFKTSGKQVSFSDGGSHQAPVKSAGSKGENRCVQSFSCVELSDRAPSKFPSIEAASGREVPCSPRRGTTANSSPKHITGSQCSSRMPEASSGTLEKQNAHREYGSPSQRARGSPQLSLVNSEAVRVLSEQSQDSVKQVVP